MKKTKITFQYETPIPKDKDGNVYTHADLNDESIFEAFDNELKIHGLELLIGDADSSDHFFCIVRRLNLL